MSIAFDRAADYYDRTRRLQPETHAALIGMLQDELRGRGPCLEIGIGTGRIALDLHGRGIPMAGIDLSAPMLAKLVEKAGGAVPFPIAVADATALPFASDTFSAAVACHVLHLIPAWPTAAEELVRTVAAGGVILAEGGDYPTSTGAEISRYFFSQTSVGEVRRLGLTAIGDLDELMRSHGLGVRKLPPIVRRGTPSIEGVIARMEAGIFSRCWAIPEAELHSAAAATRAWARQRFGSLDVTYQVESEIAWHAYDVP